MDGSTCMNRPGRKIEVAAGAATRAREACARQRQRNCLVVRALSAAGRRAGV